MTPTLLKEKQQMQTLKIIAPYGLNVENSV